MDIGKITNDDFVIDSDYKRRYIKPNTIKNMERKQKTFLNAILHETGERILVTHDQKGSPFFVDVNGKKYHIERLDLSEAMPMIPMMKESEQMKSLTDIMKTFDVKEQDDHRAKIAEREYWRKLRGDIFIAMLNKSDYKLQLLDDVAYIVDVLKAQDQEPFDDNIITRDNEILQALSIGLTDAEKDLGWSDFGGLPIEEIQDWLEKQGQTFTQKDVDDAYLKGVSDTKHELEKQEEKPQGKTALEAWKDMRLEVHAQASGNRHEPNYSDDNTKMFSLNDIDEIIEKISEQKSDNRVEPKFHRFHEGDWIAHNTANFIFEIINVDSNGYEVVNRENYKKTISFDNEDNYHRWTIADAKPGDVLTSSYGQPFIYNGYYDSYNVGAYGGICSMGDDFMFSITGKHWTSNINIHPATKEQQNVLFTKMHEAGYEWDAEKKKFKKNVIPIFNIGDTIIKKHNSDINKFGQFTITDISGGKYWYNGRIICDIAEQDEWELVEQKSAEWSEEDKVMRVWIARDKDNSLWLYTDKPSKNGDEFSADAIDGFYKIDDDFYPEVTCDNSPQELVTPIRYNDYYGE